MSPITTKTVCDSLKAAMVATACALAVIGAASTAQANEIPGGIPYQGVLELGGVPVTGSKDLRFQVVDASEALLWQGDQTVEVRQGRFSVLLIGGWYGKGLHQLIAEGRDLYLKIGIREGGDYVMFDGMQRFVPVAYATTAAFGGVPIGTVIDWFGDVANVPYGYEVADGHTVSDPASPLNGQVLPDLRGKFVRGMVTPSQQAGMAQAGGSDTHAHTTDTYHSHTANHAHSAAATTSAGEHQHLVLEYRTADNSWRDGTGITLDSNQAEGLDRTGTGSYALLRLGTDASISAYSSTVGAHTHSVAAPTATVTTGNAGSASAASTSVNNVPSYIGLLKLVRVK